MSDSDQKKQELSRQIIDRIVNDSTFREQLSADPKGALVEAGFWESYTELYTDAEVSGYSVAEEGSDYCCVTVLY